MLTTIGPNEVREASEPRREGIGRVVVTNRQDVRTMVSIREVVAKGPKFLIQPKIWN